MTYTRSALRGLSGVVALLAVAVSVGCPRPKPELEFSEETPWWNMPDPAVIAVAATPDRVAPGTGVEIAATVANVGRSESGAGELVFTVNDIEIARSDVDSLDGFAQTTVSTTWTADTPGRHQILARLFLDENSVDPDSSNNSRGALVRVSGTDTPEPELEVTLADIEAAKLVPGESCRIVLEAYNPSFADVRDVTVDFYIDGEIMATEEITYLEPGDRTNLEFPWEDVEAGEHTLRYEADLTDDFKYKGEQLSRAWHSVVPDVTDTEPIARIGRWHEMGPSLLKGGIPGLMDNCVGRMGSIVSHPTDPNILYAGAPSGGVWKSSNGGASWSPLTDKLHDLRISCVTLDPQYPDVVYASTNFWGEAPHKPDAPFFKSTDGGTNWTTFATGICQGAHELAVRHATGGDVVIYAATNRGVYRYTNADYLKGTSTVAEWVKIKTGVIMDMAVHPTNLDTVYASVAEAGLYRTTTGTTATGDASFTKLTTGLPGTSMTIDIFQSDPRYVYASNRIKGQIDIYRSVDSGDSWAFALTKVDTGGPNYVQYNPFFRVHPNKHIVYYGGGQLYKSELSGTTWTEYHISGIHVDQKALEFNPHNPDQYYALNDGGIYLCTLNQGGKDTFTHRNSDLRCTQLFRCSPSPSSANVMVAGAQDVNSILYTGAPTWTNMMPGDGNFTRIATANNQVIYMQSQYLKSTCRSDDMGVTWGSPSKDLPQSFAWGPGLGGRNGACIAVDPSDATGFTVLSQGDQVYRTSDGGVTWWPIGPALTSPNHIKRVVVQPGTNMYFAGDAQGQIYYYQGWVWYKLVAAHGLKARVNEMAFAPTDPNVLFVLYETVGDWGRIDRIHRIEKQTDGTWKDVNITGFFPWWHAITVNNKAQLGTPVELLSIAGDGYSSAACHVGTDKGVLRGEADAVLPWYNWKPYNDGLPLAQISDMHVDPTSKKLRAATWGRGAWQCETGP